MSEKVQSRAALKQACLEVFESVCVTHPAGHQSKLAARYVLVARDGERIALMFEKGPSSPANLWMRAEHAAHIQHLNLARRDHPAADLYSEADEKGRPIYGRHAALKPMRELANADLVKLEIKHAMQLRTLLSELAR